MEKIVQPSLSISLSSSHLMMASSLARVDILVPLLSVLLCILFTRFILAVNTCLDSIIAVLKAKMTNNLGINILTVWPF